MERKTYHQDLIEKVHETLFNNAPIGLDFDGVLTDSAVPVVQKFNKIFKTSYQPKEMDQWDALVDWAVKKGRSFKVAKKICDKLWTDPDILSKAPAVAGAIGFTQFLVQQKIPFSIISSREPHLKKCTTNWISRQMPWVDTQKIYLRTHDEKSNSTDGATFKAVKINDLGIRLHFEDSSEHAEKIIGLSPFTKIILVAYLYNQDVRRHPRIFREEKMQSQLNLWRLHEILSEFNVAQSY